MKLLKIKLIDFKGFTEKEIEFSDRTAIEGRNGSGKTTIFDAHLWLFCDKDSGLKSNPNIRPDDGKECVPRVEETWDIDGRIITIAKMQKKKAGKPDSNGISKITLTNTYEINSVPKTERDFKKDLTELGFDFDNFLACSHIDAFTGNKAADMRKVLFGMATSRTDQEIAEMAEDCKDLAELLKMHKAEEIEAMNKASKKKADEQIDAIPNQIIGLEKAKINIDTAELELQKAGLKREIEDIECQISDSRKSLEAYDLLVAEIKDLKKSKGVFEDTARAELESKRKAVKEKLDEAQCIMRDKERDLKQLQREFEQVENDIKKYADSLKRAQDEYTEYSAKEFDENKLNKIKAEEFNENSLVCPTCGQMLPEQQAEKVRSDFEVNKAKRIHEEELQKTAFEMRNDEKLEAIIESGNKAKQGLKEAQSNKATVEQKINQIRGEIESQTDEIERLNEELSKVPNEVDLSNNEEYMSFQSQISSKESELASMDNGSEYRKEKELELKAKRQELSKIEAKIAKAENDIRIDDQIGELEKKKLEYAQKKADAERILYQLSLLSKAKNTFLEKDINKWFDGARFKLFDFLKNGEYKEICLLEILNEKDEWKSIGSTANTALEMKGKLAVIAGLQKFYGVSYPVFVDYASELDNNTLDRIQTDFQAIFLKVSNGNLEVKELA